MKTKLTPREAALVARARRKAVAEYKSSTEIVIEVNGLVCRRFTIADHEAWNHRLGVREGRITIEAAPLWRKVGK